MFKSALFGAGILSAVKAGEINTDFYTGNGSAGLWWYDSANPEYIAYEDAPAGLTLDEISVCTF